MKNNKTWFSKPTVNLIKAICAIIIVVHHTSYYLPDSIFSAVFRPIGFLPVGIFLFISGYGLLASLYGNPRYLDSFFKKRIPSICIPAIIGLFAYLFCSYTYFSFNAFFNGQLPYSHYWYVIVILFLYIIFYAIFRLVNNKTIAVFSCFVLLTIYAAILGLYGVGSYWYYTIYAYPTGMLMCLVEREYLYRLDTKKRKVFGSILLFVSIVLFILTTTIKYSRAFVDNYQDFILLRITDFPGVMVLITLISSASLPVVLFSSRINIAGKYDNFLIAKISYEIYLIHNLFIYLYNYHIGFTNTYEVVFILVVSILSAYLLSLIDQILCMRPKMAS